MISIHGSHFLVSYLFVQKFSTKMKTFTTIGLLFGCLNFLNKIAINDIVVCYKRWVALIIIITLLSKISIFGQQVTVQKLYLSNQIINGLFLFMLHFFEQNFYFCIVMVACLLKEIKKCNDRKGSHFLCCTF